MAIKRRGGLSDKEKAALGQVANFNQMPSEVVTPALKAGSLAAKGGQDALPAASKDEAIPKPAAAPEPKPVAATELPKEEADLAVSAVSEPTLPEASSSMTAASGSQSSELTVVAGTSHVANFDIIYNSDDPDRVRVLEKNLGELGMIHLMGDTTRIRVVSEEGSSQKVFDILISKTTSKTGRRISANAVTMEDDAEVSFRLAVKTLNLELNKGPESCELGGLLVSAELILSGAGTNVTLSDSTDGRQLSTIAVENMKSSRSKQIEDGRGNVHSVVARQEFGEVTVAVLFDEVADVDLEPDVDLDSGPAAPGKNPVSPFAETAVGEMPTEERPSFAGLGSDSKTISGMPERPLPKEEATLVCKTCGREETTGKFCSDCGTPLTLKSELKAAEPKAEPISGAGAKSTPPEPPKPAPVEKPAAKAVVPAKEEKADETVEEAEDEAHLVSTETDSETDLGNGFSIRAAKPETGYFGLCVLGQKSPVEDEDGESSWLNLSNSSDATATRAVRLRDGRRMTVTLKRNSSNPAEVFASLEYEDAPKEEKIVEEKAPAKETKKKSTISLKDYLAPAVDLLKEHWKSAAEVSLGLAMVGVGIVAAFTGFASTAAALPILGGAVLLGAAVVTEMYFNKKNN